jgi:hypothetical protein
MPDMRTSRAKACLKNPQGRFALHSAVTTNATRTLAAPLLWIIYLVLPVAGWGLLDGRPLGPLSAIAIAAISWLAHVESGFSRTTDGPPEGGRYIHLAIVALLLKIALGALLIPRGFDARYYANADFAGGVESGVESPSDGVTRIDHRLRFGFDRAPDVPLHFFNELRFNYYKDTDPDRKTLPFSVSWQGWWRVGASGPQQLYAHTPDGPVTITIGDRAAIRIDPTDSWHDTVDLPSGFQRVTIAWSVPHGAARRFDIGRVVDGREEPR